MSLIEEALRRVQEPLITAAQQASPKTRKPPQEKTTAHSWETTPAPAPFSKPAPQATNTILVVVAVILGLAAVLIAGGVFLMGRALRQREPLLANEAASSAPGSPTSPQTKTLTPSGAPKGFVLSGVVGGLGEPYAMINGLIVGVGQQVGDATLLEITNSSVKLRGTDGKEIVLRVSR